MRVAVSVFKTFGDREVVACAVGRKASVSAYENTHGTQTDRPPLLALAHAQH